MQKAVLMVNYRKSAGILALGAICLLAFMRIAIASPEFVEWWKGAGWKTDFDKTTISLNSIKSGGPPRDGIPPIDNPLFIDVADEKLIADNEPVMALTIEGETRGYPLRIMTWHEIVNDQIGDVPVTVTYCPLCNAALVFDRRHNGDVLDFGTTGKLRNSDLVMYDRQTDSWWQQFTGEAIVGSYAGDKLTAIPSRLMSFVDFKTEFSDAKILIPNNPEMRAYGDNPYIGYDSAEAPFLYDGMMPEGIEPMERVIVIRRGTGDPVVVAMKVVANGGVFLADGGYQVSWTSGQASALDQSQIAASRDVGSIRVTKDCQDVVHDITFAFVAHAFLPSVPIIKE